jgi:hypothetical protein
MKSVDYRGTTCYRTDESFVLPMTDEESTVEQNLNVGVHARMPGEELGQVVALPGGKITGGDGRQLVATRRLFCDRCSRLGPIRNCKECAGLWEGSGRTKKRGRAAKPTSGGVKFDWKQFEAAFGALYRQPDHLKRAYAEKARSNDQGDDLRKTLSEFRTKFRQWYRELSGLEPPSE